MALGEFEIIAKYFQKPINRPDVITGSGDDCAVLSPWKDKNLLATIDTLLVNRHFFEDTAAFDIGYKAVAVSVSDIAAMGGDPAWLLLSLTMEQAHDGWLKAFAEGVYSCADRYNLALAGGNLSRGPLSVTTQVTGFCEQGKQLSRRGAQPGDLIYITGATGGAGLALAILKNEISSNNFNQAEIKALKDCLWHPEPRVTMGKLLSDIATAAIDISDGLIADLGHLLNQSRVSGVLYLDKLPSSAIMDKLPEDVKNKLQLTAGDDYELCFTVPSSARVQVAALAKLAHCAVTEIGVIEEGAGLRILNADQEMKLPCWQGYQHF